MPQPQSRPRPCQAPAAPPRSRCETPCPRSGCRKTRRRWPRSAPASMAIFSPLKMKRHRRRQPQLQQRLPVARPPGRHQVALHPLAGLATPPPCSPAPGRTPSPPRPPPSTASRSRTTSPGSARCPRWAAPPRNCRWAAAPPSGRRDRSISTATSNAAPQPIDIARQRALHEGLHEIRPTAVGSVRRNRRRDRRRRRQDHLGTPRPRTSPSHTTRIVTPKSAGTASRPTRCAASATPQAGRSAPRPPARRPCCPAPRSCAPPPSARSATARSRRRPAISTRRHDGRREQRRPDLHRLPVLAARSAAARPAPPPPRSATRPRWPPPAPPRCRPSG